MFFPKVSTPTNTRESISIFGGYHRAERIADGEFYDMTNLTSDEYPVFAPRKPRAIILQAAKEPMEYFQTATKESYESSLSKVMVYYTTGKIRNDGRHTYAFSYTVPIESSRAELTTIRTDADGKEISREKETVTRSGEYIYEFDGDAPVIEIRIAVRVGDAGAFDPEKEYFYGTVYRYYEKIRGILCKDQKLAYLLAQSLYYDGKFYDLSVHFRYGDDLFSDVTLVSYNTQILIFPQGIYFDTAKKESGTLGAQMRFSQIVTYTLCDLDGTAITATAQASAPSSPQPGDYWLCTKTGSQGLYLWDANAMMWQAIATTYIKIDLPGVGERFSEGDAVYMNTKFTDINEGSIIEKIDENYIIVVGLMGTALDTEDFTEHELVIERRLPVLSHVCVSNNRVWGCYKGEKDGEIVNEIYASKLGDPKNWYYFDGTSVDSFVISVGSDGEFTGAIEYQGCPTFFKENVMYRIFGSYPAQYQLMTHECRGVQKGSDRSLAVVGEYLLYKSITDICVFDGSNPVGISDSLGRGMFGHAAAGGCKDKYYISMEDENGQHSLFVYDIRRGMWHREDGLAVSEFAYNNLGQLYGQDGMKIYGFGSAADRLKLKCEKEEDVEWEAVTGYFGMNYERGKYTGLITVRAKIPPRAEIIVDISVDDGPWEQKKIMRGEGIVKSYEAHVDAEYCDHYRLRLHGHGDVRIYSVTRHMEGTDED